MTDYIEMAQSLLPELSALRKAIHSEPELGNEEFKTAARIEAFLHSCGIETDRLLDTAVVGTLHGALPGSTVALRADMDALPLTEQSGAPFASRVPGKMHACGHDVHIASVLGAAKLLSMRRESLRGTVKFFFEPDEEGNGGAQRMIAAGCMEGVSAVFGAHVSPDLPLGSVGVRYGKFYAASDTFAITLHGRSAHGAEPEKGIDALSAAADLVGALESLPGGRTERCILSIGTLNAGSALNVIADTARLTGILRTLGPQNRLEMRALLEKTTQDTAARHGCTADVLLHESYSGVVNTQAETALVEETASALPGVDRVVRIAEPSMTTEDFGYFVDSASGSYYHIGAGCPLPLHNPGFLPNERAISIAAALHTAVVENYLNQHQMD